MPGVFVSLSNDTDGGQTGSPKRVLLQFRVIANAARAPARLARTTQPVAGRKLLALSVIARTPGLGVNGLAAALGVRQPTASQVVRTLAKLHLVAVGRDGRDRRAVRIRASALGLAVLNELPPRFDFGDRLPEALSQLDSEALGRLESELAVLVEALARTAPAHVPEDADASFDRGHGIRGRSHC